jgi:hypothetical protein
MLNLWPREVYLARGYPQQAALPAPGLSSAPSARHPKLAVTQAILRGGLAFTTVLSATLARDLLNTP